jgi:hypothetical protein
VLVKKVATMEIEITANMKGRNSKKEYVSEGFPCWE